MPGTHINISPFDTPHYAMHMTLLFSNVTLQVYITIEYITIPVLYSVCIVIHMYHIE